jgi:hypothetical protein
MWRESAPYLLLVTVDTLQADHCSVYGDPKPTIPNLDRVAAAGLRVELRRWREARGRPAEQTLSEQDRASLQALGYVQ